MPTLTVTAPARAIVFLGMLCAVLSATLIRPAHASFHTYQINELYSNADGSVQFIELHEAQGFPSEIFLTGHTISVTKGVTTHTFTFPNDLPNVNTANRSVLIATQGYVALGLAAPDYIIPAGFLLTTGGTVNYAGVDSVGYTSLPIDGVLSLNRAGTTGINSPANFSGQTGSIAASPPQTIADFNGDSSNDLAWYGTGSGDTQLWLMANGLPTTMTTVLSNPSWRVMRKGLLNSDNFADLLWRNTGSGEWAMWLMNGTSFAGGRSLLTDLNWMITHHSNFNGSTNAELVWRNTATGATALWLMNGLTFVSGAGLLTDPNWRVTHLGDFNGDGKTDVLWRNDTTGTRSCG